MKTNKTAKKHRSSVIGELLNEITPRERAHTEFRMTLAARLDDLIKSRGWTKSEFAAKMDKQPSEITKWLSGTHNFTTETLMDIALILGIHVGELFLPKPRQVVHDSHMVVKGMIKLQQDPCYGPYVQMFMGSQYETRTAGIITQKQLESFI